MENLLHIFDENILSKIYKISLMYLIKVWSDYSCILFLAFNWEWVETFFLIFQSVKTVAHNAFLNCYYYESILNKIGGYNILHLTIYAKV